MARGQVNHGGADWITGTETVSGHHYNIGRFVVPGGTTLTVQSSLVVDCVSAIVDGVIDGNYRGNAGIGGGGGGGGGADQNKPGKGGAATPNAGSGASGAGQEGGTVRGGNGGNGVGGASGGLGNATSNGAKGDDGANAVGALSVGDGVNLGLLWAFDDPGSYEGLIGGGGRGGPHGDARTTGFGGGGGLRR